ncbi:hypothetical protein DAEQUDRAFT_671556 [Daedalea quercina L-15889]|uniref:Uncharacterized protein n=1 Tax=Daedalea quercina L-15889 TaxID=1314783 RepID=A0A165PM29_9APHY|nr:hypothetical protein DAEQUDRAFT_671556 [Daedalea quercina L-15889]
MLGELSKRRYQRAVDNLERLVVQRLFELSKLGISGIGYKMREKIGKALKAHAEAIRKAITEYNRHAARLNPPRPPLSPTEVMNVASLSEFDLLRDTHQDVRQQPWAQQANRKATNAYFNVKRAHEEIKRLNVESVRLFTSVVDEHFDYYCAISRTLFTDPPLAQELSVRWTYRDRVNKKIAHCLQQTASLSGFTGNLLYGRRVGREVSSFGVPLPSWATWSNGTNILPIEHTHAAVNTDSESDDDDEDEVVVPGTQNGQEAANFVHFVDRLALDNPDMDSE